MGSFIVSSMAKKAIGCDGHGITERAQTCELKLGNESHLDHAVDGGGELRRVRRALQTPASNEFRLHFGHRSRASIVDGHTNGYGSMMRPMIFQKAHLFSAVLILLSISACADDKP